MTDLTTMRTDVIGSLLRPQRLKQARHRFDAGEADDAELQAVEDECIREAVALQEDAGLEVVTDGEFRRLNFQDSFGACVEGFRSVAARIETLENPSREGKALQRWDVHRDVEAGVPIWHRLPAAERLRLARNLPLDEYRHVSGVARVPAKVTLIGPDRISQRFDHENSRDVYPTVDDFLADVVAIEKTMVASLVEAGCRYVQIDAPGYTAYVDEPSLEAMRQRGEDPDAEPGTVHRRRQPRSSKPSETRSPASTCAAATSAACGTGRAPTTRWPSACSASLKHRRLLLEYDSESAPAGSSPCGSSPTAPWWFWDW